MRVREIQQDETESIYDVVHDKRTTFVFNDKMGTPQRKLQGPLIYNEADFGILSCFQMTNKNSRKH